MAILLGALEQSNSYPVSAIRDVVVFPRTENVLVFGRKKSLMAIDEALKKDKKIVLLMQKNPSQDDPKATELYQIGILATIEKTVVGEKGEVNALVKGIEKIKVLEFTKEI
ncbi:endopeptidase La, partial [Candidatus Roizmanbacteria bacterium CG09_land_8_20_14_0_10_41_9]